MKRQVLALLGLFLLLVAIAGCTTQEGGLTGHITAREESGILSGYVWKEVAIFQGQYDKVTDGFNISSDVWRIIWNCQSDRDGELNIYVFPVGSHVIHKSFLGLHCPGSGRKYIQKGMREAFFIKTRTSALGHWEILVEQ